MKILGYCITKGIKQKQSNHKEQFPSKARKFTLTLHSALCTLPFALCPLHSALCTLPFALCPLHSALCPLHSKNNSQPNTVGCCFLFPAGDPKTPTTASDLCSLGSQAV